MMQRTKLSVILLLLLLVNIPKHAVAQDVNYKAYTLFVYNFMKYIEWPENDSKADFTIGILGNTPVEKELENLAKLKKAKGRTIVVKKLETPEDAAGCQLVYVSASKSNTIKNVQDKIKGKPVLVVGEREGLAHKGAALSFVTLEDDVLKFDINKSVIEQHSLKISSSLVALGLVIN